MRIQVNNTELYYVKEGKGHPLLLLHGNGEDHTIFNLLIHLLKDDFEVYAIDSRNHGQSEKTEDYSYNKMADDIYSFIKINNFKDPYVVGFSDGAIVSLLCELNYPLTFSKMVWLGINLKPLDFLPKILERLKEAYKESKDPLLKLMLEEPNININDLAKIHTHTLVVMAEKELFKKELYETIIEVMPNAQLLEMKGHKHDSYIVDSDVLYGDLMYFFR